MCKISDLIANYNGEDKYKAQMQTVYYAWQEVPATMKEIQVKTGIDRSNICRYVDKLRKASLIAALNERKCSITKRSATEFTTNQMLFPPVLQSSLFESKRND